MASGDDSRITKSVSNASKELAEGEVLGLITKGNFDLTENEYMDIIYRKTASLISVSCKIGAFLGNATQEKEKALANFGLKVGMAFQLIDDVLDYTGSSENFGKVIGLDFQKNKMTLPLIYLFKKASAKDKEKIQELIQSEMDFSEKMNILVKMMESYDAFEYVMEKARIQISEAMDELAIFDESPYLDAIMSLAEYVVYRKN